MKNKNDSKVWKLARRAARRAKESDRLQAFKVEREERSATTAERRDAPR